MDTRKGSAIILVVDHRGITQDSIDLLYKSGFLNSLLYTSEDPANNPVLVIAVVKVDDIAETRWASDRTKRKAVHLKAVCIETIETIKKQFQVELEKKWSLDAPETSEQRTKVLNNILSTLQVHPVSAIQYRRILANDEEDRAFITDPDESNIPRFALSLQDVARERRQRIKESLEETAGNFFLQVNAAVNVIHAQWTEEDRAQEESTRLRDELRALSRQRKRILFSARWLSGVFEAFRTAANRSFGKGRKSQGGKRHSSVS